MCNNLQNHRIKDFLKLIETLRDMFFVCLFAFIYQVVTISKTK